MNRDIVKRLAIQSGINLQFFGFGELFEFANAIAKQAVEDYKASLVPVGYVSKDTAKYFGNTSYEFTGVFRYGFHEDSQIPIYVLGVNDERLGEIKLLKNRARST